MNYRWRTIDIVIASIIAVTFGVIFWAWNIVWGATDAAFAFFPPAQTLLYGVWLMPAVLGGLIIRKPGAALFAEVVAASLSALLGSLWGVDTLLSGLMQGAAAELVFAATRYRSYGFPTLAAAGLAASAAAFVHDWYFYYSGYATDVLLLTALWMAVSGAILLPLAAIGLVKALRPTGVLDGFPA